MSDPHADRMGALLMKDGSRSRARKLLVSALESAKRRIPGADANAILTTALSRLMPFVELKVRRVGGALHQVPVPVSESRRIALAAKALLGAARKRKAASMSERPADAIAAAYKGEFIRPDRPGRAARLSARSAYEGRA